MALVAIIGAVQGQDRRHHWPLVNHIDHNDLALIADVVIHVLAQIAVPVVKVIDGRRAREIWNGLYLDDDPVHAAHEGRHEITDLCFETLCGQVGLMRLSGPDQARRTDNCIVDHTVGQMHQSDLEYADKENEKRQSDETKLDGCGAAAILA